MAPASNSGIASFSFCVPASRPAIIHLTGDDHPSYRADPPQPPSGWLLRSAATKAVTAQLDCISTLPSMLIHMIKTWLTDRDSLLLICTSRAFRHEVQRFYQLRLRADVAKLSGSAIAKCQNTVNLKPALVYMGPDGERMLARCLSMKASDLSEINYCSSLFQLLQSHCALATESSKDLNQLKEVFTAAGLALGGTEMSAPNRDALLAFILGSCKSSSHAQMCVMIQGVCAAIGPRLTKYEHYQAMYNQILDSYQTSSTSQMGSMVRGLCIFWGGINMSRVVRRFVISKILVSSKTLDGLKIRGLIYSVCLALGGRNMTPQNRDGLMQQILAQYNTHRDLPLEFILRGLFKGLGDTEMRFHGRNMKPADIEAVLEHMLGCHATWDNAEMEREIGTLCWNLGGMRMSAGNRDIVLTRILAGSASCSPDQMGAMILSVCHSLGGKTPARANAITQDNLAALIGKILASHALFSQAHMGTVIHYLFRALGQVDMTAQHRDGLAAQIRKSGRAQEIMEAIRLTPVGEQIVNFLQMNSAGERVNTTI